MTDKTNPTTRRTILIGAGLMAGLPLLAASGQANAAGTMPKTNVHYQETPKGAAQCSKCNYFLAGAGPGGGNLCKIIAGPIAPTGWCTMFAPKHA
jgi:hypothetical protein